MQSLNAKYIPVLCKTFFKIDQSSRNLIKISRNRTIEIYYTNILLSETFLDYNSDISPPLNLLPSFPIRCNLKKKSRPNLLQNFLYFTTLNISIFLFVVHHHSSFFHAHQGKAPFYILRIIL